MEAVAGRLQQILLPQHLRQAGHALLADDAKQMEHVLQHRPMAQQLAAHRRWRPGKLGEQLDRQRVAVIQREASVQMSTGFLPRNLDGFAIVLQGDR